MGAQAPGNDVLVGLLWVAMDNNTKTHVSGKIDVAEAVYADVREAVLKHVSLIGAANQRPSNANGRGRIG